MKLKKNRMSALGHDRCSLFIYKVFVQSLTLLQNEWRNNDLAHLTFVSVIDLCNICRFLHLD